VAKGDHISVYLRGIDGPIHVIAEKAGRKLEEDWAKESGVPWFLVHESTWTGKRVKTTRFSASEIVAIVADIKEVAD